MSRWYAALKKISETDFDETDRTDKTLSSEVSSVLSVPDLGKSEIFQNVRGGSVSFVSAANERIENFSAHVDALDLHTDFIERAAIIEFDGGLHREEAEAIAWREVYGDRPRPS